jgi:hypothetical protein
MQNHVSFVIGVHYMTHHINLVVQTLSGLNLVKRLFILIFFHVQLFYSQP